MPPEVKYIQSKQAEVLGAVLARAFSDDPANSYIFRGRERRINKMQWMFTRWVRILMPRGAAYTTPDLAGAALWVPPQAVETVRLWEYLRAGFWRAPFLITPGEARRAIEMFADANARARGYLDRPHWVLDTLGVAPEYQRKGVASALIEVALVQADRGHHPCLVITHNPRNIIFYQRFGFVPLESDTLKNCPQVVITVLRRPPQ